MVSTTITNPRGDSNSPIWFVGYKPTEDADAKGVVYMDSSGFLLDRMVREAQLPQPYFTTLQPNNTAPLPDDMAFQALLAGLDRKKPKIIITCDGKKARNSKDKEQERWESELLKLLCPETQGILDRYNGSLLRSDKLNFEHYIIPIQPPLRIFQDYAEKDICVSVDLGKAREELAYWRKNGKLQPLPVRELIVEPHFDDLMYFLLCDCRKASYLSNDIETIRPQKKSEIFKDGHPGYPYVVSLATSPYRAFSFSLWDYSPDQCLRIWRELDWLMRNIPQIGQNFFLFDALFYEAMGFRPNVKKCIDTKFRHHILWPELPHSLQFQTRQYTREPYYKDEGKGWSPKHKKQLMYYNNKDTCCTYEIFLAQEEEFNDRPHLR